MHQFFTNFIAGKYFKYFRLLDLFFAVLFFCLGYHYLDQSTATALVCFSCAIVSAAAYKFNVSEILNRKVMNRILRNRKVG